MGDVDSRYAMAVADTYAGICITASRTVMVHGIGNTVSGVYPNIDHGQALACLSGPIMRFNIEKGDAGTVSRYCDIARALGEDVTRIDKENALKSVGAMEKMLGRIGLMKGLAEFGVDEAGIQKMTEYSLKLGMGAISCNPVKPTREDIVKMYREAL
jgi:alcohol dehydrogenase class IV